MIKWSESPPLDTPSIQKIVTDSFQKQVIL